MRFAFETVIWGRRIEDLDLVLDTIAACGYQGIELAQNPDSIFLQDAAFPRGLRRLDGIGELLEMLARRGLTLVGLAGGPLGRRMDFCGDYRGSFLYVEDIGEEEARAMALPNPFTLALHPHWFMRVQRMDDARELLEKYSAPHPVTGRPLLQLLPDTAHLTLVEDDPAKVVTDFFDRLAAVHLKDWDPAFGRYSHRYSQGFVSLGNGQVKLTETLKTLQDKRFEGWVIVEQDLADPSPARSVRECSEWLHQQGMMKPVAPARLNDIIARERRAATVSRPSEQMARTGLLFEQLLPVTLRGPDDFYQKVVEMLGVLYDLEVAKLYSYYPLNDLLYLRAMHGVDGCQCKRIVDLKPKAGTPPSPYTTVIKSQISELFDLTNPGVRDAFADPEFFKCCTGNWMFTVPIFNPSNTHHLRFLLSVVPRGDPLAFQQQLPELEAVGMLISRLADHVADDICSAASTRASLACGGVTSRKDLLIELRKFIQTTFRSEAVSIFLVDETGERMTCEPYATTGLEWAESRRGNKEYYQRWQGTTGTVWAKREMLLAPGFADQIARQGDSWETGCNKRREEILFAPIAKTFGKVLGVIRVVNKSYAPEFRGATMFTDEDAAIMDAIIQAAVPHLVMLTAQELQKSAVSRMTHELRMPLVAIRGATNFAQRDLARHATAANPIFRKDYLKDILNWTQLMGRLANNAQLFAAQEGNIKLQSARTLLLADVVAPAVNQMGLLLNEARFTKVEVHYDRFESIPPLWVDKNQLQQVVFNLLANAIKYSGSTELRVKISSADGAGFYLIGFEDYGIGIPKGMEQDIFLPGFRAPAARESNVSGQGIGLFVVRRILRAHGGDIVLRRNENPTLFELRLPHSLRSQPSKRAL